MKFTSRTAAAALVVAGLAWPCTAGEVRLAIGGGLVSLDAKDATPREILAEWSRVGQTRIVNAERVPGGPITLQLSNVPEAKALDIVLRSVAGYLAAPRVVAASAGASRYDRLVIMPMPRPAAGGPSPATATTQPATYDRGGRMGSQGPGSVQSQPNLMVDDQDERVDRMGPDGPGRSPQMLMPGQQMGPGMGPGVAQPGMTMPGQSQQMPYYLNPQQQPPATPGMMTSPSPAAARPGMITAPPKPVGPGGPGGN